MNKYYVKNLFGACARKVIHQILFNNSPLIGNTIVIHDGFIETLEPLTKEEINIINQYLIGYNLCLLEHPGEILSEQIKKIINDYENSIENNNIHVNLSVYVEEKSGYSYCYLSKIFHKYAGCTMEQYSKSIKLIKIKNLLIQGKTVSEITTILDFSSCAHLSNFFKKRVGVNPSVYVKSV